MKLYFLFENYDLAKTRLEKNILGEMEFITYLHSLLTSIQDIQTPE